GNKLLVPYLDGRANQRVAVLNTITNTVLETLDFGSDTPTFLINDTGDMAVITGDNGVEYGYAEYDLTTLQKKSEENFSLKRFFSPGPLNADLIDGVLYYLNFYAQPALVPFGPAVYDFQKMESKVIDMIAIVQEVQNELQTNITLTSLGYEEIGGVFIVGYSKEENTVLEGGVLIISADGDLLRNITLPFAPTYVVR
ncbi:MAG TPA: hypothetical protein VKN36_11755, partial [Eudoraea sp.]|nr:hypothetical protein [Eudoraea sp.]